MITRDELREALAVTHELLEDDTEQKLLMVLLDSSALYKICGLTMRYLGDYDMSGDVLKLMQQQAEAAEGADPLYSEDHYRLRFVLMKLLTFGTMLGWSARDIQANYKPPQPREQTRRRRR